MPLGGARLKLFEAIKNHFLVNGSDAGAIIPDSGRQAGLVSLQFRY